MLFDQSFDESENGDRLTHIEYGDVAPTDVLQRRGLHDK